MKNSADYPYYSFDQDNSILYHEVNDDNFGDKESFVTSLSYLTTLIDRFKPKRLLVKVLKKPDFFELALKDFMQKTLHATLLKVGTQKVAFYVSDEKHMPELIIHERNESIMVKFFLDVDLAKAWLVS